jgi:Rad3-related DNA helicase
MKQFGSESRPGQLQFYNSSLSKLTMGGVLLCEAPPGVGKTLAYLNAAVTSGKFPVVIAVHRHALQDQIIGDCAKHFPDLKAVVVKGHASYGCGRDLPEWARGELPKDMTPEEREKVSSQKCLKVGECYAKQAKVASYSADIVVCTHTMLVVDQRVRKITDGAAQILPTYYHLIIDEAHCLYDEAINTMSHKVTTRSFLRDEEELCIEWLKAFKKRVFTEAPEGVDGIIDTVSSREHYQLYQQAVTDNGGEEDLASGQLLAQYGEASFRQISRNHGRTAGLIEALESIGGEGTVSWSEESGVIEVKPKECHELTADLFRKSGVVACSATLPFALFRSEHRVPKDAQELTVESSFDKSKVKLIIKGPHPTKMRFSHRKLVTESLQYLAKKHGGNILVLCSSYDMAGHARDALASVPNVVAQEPGRPLPDFPDGGILIACESAWAGFDHKGLKAVVITQVPYQVPDPWVNALLSDRGWPWYNARAKTKLIQGIGRLQRSAEDSGLVLILDDRAKRLVKAS